MPGRSPLRLNRRSRTVGSEPIGEIGGHLSGAEDGGQTHETSVVGIFATKKTLNERFVSHLSLVNPNHVAFVKNDETHVVENAWLVA